MGSFVKVDSEKRPDMNDVVRKIESVKSDVMSDPSVQTAWETLHTSTNNQRIRVDERTMGSRDLVKELTQMDLNAQNGPNITGGTGLHFQKMSNLCVYFASMSAVRHEMKKIIGNSISAAVTMDIGNIRYYQTSIPIPCGKSIDELFKEKEFRFLHPYGTIVKFPNALSFERMLSVLLGCVSPRALSGLVKIINIHL